MGKPVIYIANCTWNRASRLADTLAGRTRLVRFDALDWEVIVVNNNCSDPTDELLESHASLLPLRHIGERTQELSHARSAVVDAFRGDYIVWTDDDVPVDPSRRAACADAFERHLERAVFGSPALAATSRRSPVAGKGPAPCTRGAWHPRPTGCIGRR